MLAVAANHLAGAVAYNTPVLVRFNVKHPLPGQNDGLFWWDAEVLNLTFHESVSLYQHSREPLLLIVRAFLGLPQVLGNLRGYRRDRTQRHRLRSHIGAHS